MSYSTPESPDSPPSSACIRRYEGIYQQMEQDQADMVEQAARLKMQGEEHREAVALNRNNFLANWIDGHIQGLKRACQMVIMTFNSDNKDYFNQWNSKKLMSEEEFNKVTFPLCSPLCFSSSGANHKLVKGSGVGQRGGLAGFLLLFPWEHKGLSL